MWIADTVGEASIEVVRERSWGDVWRVHAANQTYWFKAPHPSMRAEVGVRRLLEDRAGQWVLPLVAANADYGWQLTRDQGSTLAARARQDGQTYHEAVAMALAEVQRRVSAESLAGVELEVFHPADAARNLERWGRWLTELPGSHPAHVEVGEFQAAIRRQEDVADEWRGLDETLLSVDHNDLHLGNAYPGPLISDWGDAVVSHPFCSLRRLAFDALGAGGDGLRVRVEEAYLSVWGDAAQQRRVLELAYRLTSPQRLLCWQRLGDLDVVADFAQYVTPLITEAGKPLQELTTA